MLCDTAVKQSLRVCTLEFGICCPWKTLQDTFYGGHLERVTYFVVYCCAACVDVGGGIQLLYYHDRIGIRTLRKLPVMTRVPS